MLKLILVFLITVAIIYAIGMAVYEGDKKALLKFVGLGTLLSLVAGSVLTVIVLLF